MAAITTVLFDLNATLCYQPTSSAERLSAAFDRAGVEPFFEAPAPRLADSPARMDTLNREQRKSADRDMASQFDAAGTSIPTATLAVRGVVAMVLAILVNGLLLGAVLATNLVEPFEHLALGRIALFSALGAVGAAIVFGLLTRRAERPDRAFIIVAVIVLLLSFGPDVWLLQSEPDATVGGVAVLMVMHVVVAASSVFALTDRYSPIAR